MQLVICIAIIFLHFFVVLMYAIVDIETTGGNYRDGKITEIAILHFDGEKVTDKFTTLINPQQPVQWFVKNLTGISDDMLKHAPTFSQVAKKIIEYTQDRIFVAHNVAFDYNFIKHEFELLGYNFDRKKMCTVKMSRKIIPGLPSYSLGRLCESLDIKIMNQHRAEGDAQATALLVKHLIATTGQNPLLLL
jgi:DNA polymerase-3 subunit epsilon